MLVRHHSTAVAAIIFFAHLIIAIPTASSLSLYSSPVLYSWSTEPVCRTSARTSDCITAYTALCAGENLKISNVTTVGDCTAFYWYDTGNTISTGVDCTAAYKQIIAASTWGALGYNAAKNRTNDPLYAIYPKDGNANCFKAPGDTSPVLALDAIPGGRTLPTCPLSSSRRRHALETLEGRDLIEDESHDVITCYIEDGVWGVSCTMVCLATVTTAAWITGPFVAAGWLACLGGCSATGTKVYNNCMKAKGDTGPASHIPYIPPLWNREVVTESVNPCVNIKQWSFQCPAQRSGLLNAYGCQGSINT